MVDPAALHRLALEVASGARSEGRSMLLEPEGMEIARALGLDVPTAIVLDSALEVPPLDTFAGSRVVVKLLSSQVAHRTEVGGVQVVPRTPDAVARALEELAARSPDSGARFLVQEFVDHDVEPGGELLLGLRWSREFGAVLTLALGGVTAEALSSLGRPGALSRTWCVGMEGVGLRGLSEDTFGALLTGTLRGRAPRVTLGDLRAALDGVLARAEAFVPAPFTEVEFNPVVFRAGRPVALDALVRLAPDEGPAASGGLGDPGRRAAIRALLHPRSLAVVGASARSMNPGRIILRNVLTAGMDPSAVQVVKDGADTTLDGCRCVPDVASLEPVDVLVVSVAAEAAVEVLDQATGAGVARSAILTSGGLGEGGTDEGAARLAAVLRKVGAPVLNGGNCLGIRSVPGRYDTLFIPPRKLGFPDGPPHPVALVSQSGAFAIARASALPWLNPRFVVTVGNQADLTVGEWVESLVDEADLDVVACYVEGFQPGDGRRFLEAARAHRAKKGRQVLLYRGGRTPDGRDAAASHTASLAGDPALTRALAQDVGVLVADTVEEFSDLMALAVRLHHRTVDGRRAGLLSNAGFECVAMADALGSLERATLDADTESRLADILERARLTGVVAPRNPLDLTPMMGDEGFSRAVEALLQAPGVDVAVVGCVPLTPALQTLEDIPGSEEDVEADGGLAQRLVALWRDTEKAWVAAVDGGPRYDALARRLDEAGIPVFRRADRATALLNRYVTARLG